MWFEKVRGGSMCLNNPELVHKHPAHLVSLVKMELEKVRHSRTTPNSCAKNCTHLAISVMMWFEKVRKGSMRLKHPELVHKYPAHLVSPVKMWLEKVQYSRTTPISCQRTLHALLSLRLCSSRRFEEVRCARTSAQAPRTPCFP